VGILLCRLLLRPAPGCWSWVLFGSRPELAPSPALVGFGPAFLKAPDNYSLGADAIGERLRYSLLVMSSLERLFIRWNPSRCLDTPGSIRLADWIRICLRRL
jgi:hypothetical protein